MTQNEIKNIKIFAYIWALIFIIIGLYPLISSSDSIRVWSVLLSILMLSIGIFKPAILENIYKVWIKIGEFVGGIVSKVIMFILYFGVFTPVSIFLKILGKDLLGKKVDKSKETYWIKRETQPLSMKNQF